uniref:WRKY domain-containing protein n=1 Tax=Leersia perrieri TaxID=77586 RepID=A0A0D9V779_9ORYZ
MQAQSRLGVSGIGLGAGSGEEEHEAVVRELTRGHELTARLRAEALLALRGKGQAEATATFILGEVSRTFTVCLSIMATAGAGTSSPRRPETPPDSAVSVGAPPLRAREDNVPRKRTLTSSPYDDGFQWRKYGQKRINNTKFPRSYYRCSYHRERRCPAQKHVQRHSAAAAAGDGDDVPPLYAVVYTHEHTCQDSSPNTDLPETTPDYFLESPSSLRRRGAQAGAATQQQQQQVVNARAAMEERERQALVSSLACVLQGKQCYDDTAAAAVGAAAAATPVVVDGGEGLDVTDYDVTEPMVFWGAPFGDEGNNSYGATDVDTVF